MAQQSTDGRAFVTPIGVPNAEPEDTMPSDYQPPGVDEEVDYDSLEEALTGGIGKGAPQSRTPFSLALALQGGYP